MTEDSPQQSDAPDRQGNSQNPGTPKKRSVWGTVLRCLVAAVLCLSAIFWRLNRDGAGEREMLAARVYGASANLQERLMASIRQAMDAGVSGASERAIIGRVVNVPRSIEDEAGAVLRIINSHGHLVRPQMVRAREHELRDELLEFGSDTGKILTHYQTLPLNRMSERELGRLEAAYRLDLVVQVGDYMRATPAEQQAIDDAELKKTMEQLKLKK